MIMVILADNIEFSKYPQQRMTMHKILSQTFDLKYMVYWGPPQNIQILGQQAQNPGYNDTLMKKAYNLPPKCHEMWPMDHYHTETTN